MLPGRGQASSRQLEHALAVEPAADRYPSADQSASRFDAICSAGKGGEWGTHLALHWETDDIPSRLAAEEGPRLQNGERTSRDHDGRWVDEAAEILHLNALAAIASSIADPVLTGTDGEGSKRRIADRRVHGKTCNGE